MRLLRPTYVEVDLDIIKHNINEIKKVIDKNTKLGAVVKANAYGHGAIEVAKVLEEMKMLTIYALLVLMKLSNLEITI